MLVYFEPAAICALPTDVIIAPLPTKRQLWEASDESVWKAEGKIEAESQATLALGANGELVRLHRIPSYNGEEVLRQKYLDPWTLSTRKGNWEDWCSGMDQMGPLVMLAASLLGVSSN